MKPCTDCRTKFQPRGQWQTRCWPCWREHRDNELRQDGYHAGYDDGYRDALTATDALDGPLVADLIQLAHPDRHPAERGELANRATARLLPLRSQVRAAA